MDPIPPASSPAALTASDPTAAPLTATDSQSQAFNLALSAALNPANVLSEASGDDDDDDDGSSLSVGMSAGLPMA